MPDLTLDEIKTKFETMGIDASEFFLVPNRFFSPEAMDELAVQLFQVYPEAYFTKTEEAETRTS